MAVFDPKSRYVQPPLETYVVRDSRGRDVHVLPMPEPLAYPSAGQFVKKQGMRLDHLANSFLNDPHGFWRISEANGAFYPDSLTEIDRINIPTIKR